MGQVTIINGLSSRAVEKIDDKNMDFNLDRHRLFVNREKLSLFVFYIDGKVNVLFMKTDNSLKLK